MRWLALSAFVAGIAACTASSPIDPSAFPPDGGDPRLDPPDAGDEADLAPPPLRAPLLGDLAATRAAAPEPRARAGDHAVRLGSTAGLWPDRRYRDHRQPDRRLADLAGLRAR